MEMWTTVLVALIVALSTLGATFIQNWYSKKRFMAELGRAIDVDARKRRREVRSEPLLRLRNELARMAVLESRLTGVAYRQHLLKDVIPPEKLREQLLEAIKNRDEYLESGNLQLILNMQTDQALINRVEKIMQEYQSSYFTAEHYTQFGKKDREKGIEVFEKKQSQNYRSSGAN
jgi:hypothetical protein